MTTPDSRFAFHTAYLTKAGMTNRGNDGTSVTPDKCDLLLGSRIRGPYNKRVIPASHAKSKPDVNGNDKIGVMIRITPKYSSYIVIELRQNILLKSDQCKNLH
jgi:hypothetical protein